MNETFGQMMKRLRKEKRLNLRDLSYKTKIALYVLNDMESDIIKPNTYMLAMEIQKVLAPNEDDLVNKSKQAIFKSTQIEVIAEAIKQISDVCSIDINETIRLISQEFDEDGQA